MKLPKVKEGEKIMKRRSIHSLIVVIAALILAACGSARSEAPKYDMQGGGAAPSVEMPASAPSAGYAQGEAPSNSASGVDAASVERIVLKNAQISIVVSDVETRMKNVQVMAQQMGGYVVSSNLQQVYASNNVYVPEAQVAIRVPAEKLDAALDEIKQDVIEVKNETSSGEDVTAQYVDLKSRLKNLEAAEAQLDEIMKSATKTEDVVNIFNQLVYYREQIELVKGQIQYYEEAAALSSITVTIIAEDKEQPIQIGGWKPSGVAREAIQDLIYFYQDFVDFLIRFVIYTLPVWITIGIPLYLIFIGLRALFRKMRGTKKKEQPLEPAEKK
jgi:hypothetical protein